MEREVGGGIRMGNSCKPMAVSFQCMTKSTKIKKKKKKEKKLQHISWKSILYVGLGRFTLKILAEFATDVSEQLSKMLMWLFYQSE